MNHKAVFRLFFASSALALAACGGTDYLISSSSPPPAEREVIPFIPNPQAEIWRAGYWAPGDNGHFEWIPGKIIARPGSTAVWAPARWDHHTFGWTFVAGHWE